MLEVSKLKQTHGKICLKNKAAGISERLCELEC